ncbi:MAG: RNB domain-containing ribonuclease [Solirubrobacterales bacterium]
MVRRPWEPDRPRVALVERRGRFAVAEPFFEPGPQVSVERRGTAGAQAGRLALIEFRGRNPRVIEQLGNPSRAADVVQALVHDRGLGRPRPDAADREAQQAAERVAADPGPRRDLRDKATFTVDPASARDFDDAISAERDGDGIRLWIHIADVAAHIAPGGDLEADAYRRATSVYVPGHVQPMLPHVLSSDACSLAPQQVRPAVTAEIWLSGTGEPRQTRFYRSLIRSDVRLDYDELDEIFAGRRELSAAVAEPVRLAREAAASLADRRRDTSLEMEGSEPEFSFDDRGDVEAAREVPQTESHSLIEQLMVCTNEQVARLLEDKKVPALYRVHEQPDPARAATLVGKLDALDVPSPALPGPLSPSQAGQLVTEASRLVGAEVRRRGHGGRALRSLVLRALAQAHYTDRNLGHAGLGSTAYAHFTSPIRRFPDLVAHRALLHAVGEDAVAPTREEVSEAGPWCSAREREAMSAERAADDICAAFLLERELVAEGHGQTFEGEVVGLVGGGAFVHFVGELGPYEGFLPVRTLGGREYWDLDSSETQLIGGRTGRRLRLGDPIDVQVSKVETGRGRVDLFAPGVAKGSGGSSGEDTGEGRETAAGGGTRRGAGKPKRGGKTGRDGKAGGGNGKAKGTDKGKDAGKGKPKGKGGGKPKQGAASKDAAKGSRPKKAKGGGYPKGGAKPKGKGAGTPKRGGKPKAGSRAGGRR